MALSIQQIPRRLPRSDTGPVHVFHHIPKCGGTSLRQILAGWFRLKLDYREGWSDQYPEKKDLSALTSRHCLCGHFELEGERLWQRYPEVFIDEHYRVFTFLREPLQARMSLYRYERRHGGSLDLSLEEALFRGRNSFARILQATAEDYRQVLDRYWFIGIVEEMETSVKQLAAWLDKPFEAVPHVNRTTESGAAPDAGPVSDEVVARFREANRLDYLIYEYARERLHQACMAGSQTGLQEAPG
ncbi:MAG TPA: hypothetical protein ENJ79_03180 [Gammaproteobacteria bacterium]|nr:hypothetical protein [Gammaproteobacteria bacterium]